MPTTLNIEVPDDAFSALRTSPDAFAQELRLAATVKWYELERISQGKAAEIAGLSRAAFIDALARYGVSAVQTRPEDVTSDFRQALGRKPFRSPPGPSHDHE